MYQCGKIYKIISLHTDSIYIGSTCQPTLARRLAIHKEQRQRWLKKATGNKHMSSYELLDYPEYFIVLLESFSCNTKDELRAREVYLFD
jgi:hypothetical protein